MKNKNCGSKVSYLFVFLGIVVFVAMGLNVIPISSNIMIFIGIVCFIISGFIRKVCDNNSDDNNK